VPYDLNSGKFNFMQIAESERIQSFFYTGGLVAVHSEGRSREAIWDALKRREVYGTSGDRMLLWFDMLGSKGETAPMGSEVATNGVPHFRVRAVGDFEQKPGCPAHSVSALTPEKVEHICRGECYNPSDKRKIVDRIEVVRILPQAKPGENVADLIEDPWETFACRGDEAGCTVEFTDSTPARVGREAIYYVRAIEKASETINAGNLRCDFNGRSAHLVAGGLHAKGRRARLVVADFCETHVVCSWFDRLTTSGSAVVVCSWFDKLTTNGSAVRPELVEG
jgi:hypothetical protein